MWHQPESASDRMSAHAHHPLVLGHANLVPRSCDPFVHHQGSLTSRRIRKKKSYLIGRKTYSSYANYFANYTNCEYCCGIFHCVWNISASAGSTNNQDCIFHLFRFISFVHSYITIVLNVLLKITMLTSFMVTTSKRLNYVCPAANRTWQRLTIISCDLTHERDTYFLNISHIIHLNYYLPRINRLQSKPLRLIKTNRVNSIIRHRMWLHA